MVGQVSCDLKIQGISVGMEWTLSVQHSGGHWEGRGSLKSWET